MCHVDLLGKDSACVVISISCKTYSGRHDDAKGCGFASCHLS